MAGAPLVTFDAVQPFGTQARLTKLAGEACFTQACSTHVIALPSVNTPAGLRTASSIGPDRTFVLTPIQTRGQQLVQKGLTMHKLKCFLSP